MTSVLPAVVLACHCLWELLNRSLAAMIQVEASYLMAKPGSAVVIDGLVVGTG